MSKKSLLITTIVFALTTVILGALFVITFVKSKKTVETSSDTSTDNTSIISEDQIQAYKDEEREAILSDLQTHFENGSSVLGLLKDYFPNKVVYVDKSKYVFQDIDNNLKKNALLKENFATDNNGFITYSENGKVVSHKGVDASKFQGKIDFAKLKNQDIEYAILRCGYRTYGGGVITKDTSFDTYAADALKNDIAIGAYFFSQAINTEEALEEANFVIDSLKPYKVTYPVVIDVEEIVGDTYRQMNLSKDEMTNIVITFCEKIKEAGYTPMIYANLKGFIGILDMSKLEAYEKWFAYYGDVPYFPYEFSIWQYSESGKLDGVEGSAIDLNISFKNYK